MVLEMTKKLCLIGKSKCSGGCCIVMLLFCSLTLTTDNAYRLIREFEGKGYVINVQGNLNVADRFVPKILSEKQWRQ
jgi:hypothetical protein